MVAMVEKTLNAVKAIGRVNRNRLGPRSPMSATEGYFQIDGWASDGLEIHLMLIGAVQSLADDLLHPDQATA